MKLQCFDYLTETRQAILRELKRRGTATIPRISRDLGVSHEAVRRQLAELERLGWVSSDCRESDGDGPPGVGRPAVEYCLTRVGDNLFAKEYDELAMALLDSSTDPVPILTAFTNARVRSLSRRFSGKNRRVEALQAIYDVADPFIELKEDEGDFVLIERNCPYLNVALDRPLICSTTVSTLRRMTGREVVREDRFQEGDGRCTFRIKTDKRGSKAEFEIEPPKSR